MKAIFWGTSVFNILRALFISYLVIAAYKGHYKDLIISLNIFTMTATVPIVLYLFGFKLKQDEVTR